MREEEEDKEGGKGGEKYWVEDLWEGETEGKVVESGGEG